MAYGRDLCETCWELYRLWKPWIIDEDPDLRPTGDRWVSIANQDITFGTRGHVRQRDCPLCRLLVTLLSNYEYENGEESSDDVLVTAIFRMGYAFSPDNIKGIHLQIREGDSIRGKIGAQVTENAHRDPGFQVLPKQIDFAQVLEILESTSNPSSEQNDRSISHILSPRATTVNTNTSSSPAEITLIDVIEMKLVPASTQDRYVTLSYVWGRAGAEIEIIDRGQLFEPFALTKFRDMIPRVVMDAIYFTAQMEERYLWVDQICIDQNGFEKHTQLAHMHEIYGKAYMTLVAFSAVNADCPLPGVENTRSPLQAMVTVDDVQFFITPPTFWEVLTTVKYETRAWTFQERLLSQRCLFFSNHALYYYYDQGQLWSDSPLENLETHFIDWAINALRYDADYKRGTECSTLMLESESPQTTAFLAYEVLVTQYTARYMSFSSDVLNAFSALLNTLQGVLGPFAFGIPEVNIHLALLWVPPGESKKLHSRNELFPSWSWAGWTGHCHYMSQISQTYLGKATSFPHARQYLFRSEVGDIMLPDAQAQVEWDNDLGINPRNVLKITTRIAPVIAFTFKQMAAGARFNTVNGVDVSAYSPIGIHDPKGAFCGVLYDSVEAGFDLSITDGCYFIVLTAWTPPCVYNGRHCNHKPPTPPPAAWYRSSRNRVKIQERSSSRERNTQAHTIEQNEEEDYDTGAQSDGDLPLGSDTMWAPSDTCDVNWELIDPVAFAVTEWSMLSVMMVRKCGNGSYMERVGVCNIHRSAFDAAGPRLAEVSIV